MKKRIIGIVIVLWIVGGIIVFSYSYQREKKLRLCHAILRGDILKVKSLLQSGDSPNVRFPLEAHYNSVPLHFAVMRDDVQITKVLFEAGADPNLIDADERTPLDLALRWQHSDIIQLLTDSGGRTGAKANTND